MLSNPFRKVGHDDTAWALIRHARLFMAVYGFYLLWVALSIPSRDLRFATSDYHWAGVSMAGLVVLAGILAAVTPNRFHLGIVWLGLAVGWVIARAATIIVNGSGIFASESIRWRAGAGWLLWVPALTVTAAVVIADAARKENRAAEELRSEKDGERKCRG